MGLNISGRFASWRSAAVAVLLALSVLAMPLSARAADALKGVALVIGNGEYEHLSKLPNPENDAKAVEDLLDKLGFDTTSASDRDARRLRRDLEGFADDAEGADIAVLYYSGHGIEAGGRNYLVPVDADIASLDDAGQTLVPIDTLIDELKAKVPIVIVMLDACRDNPFPADAVLKLSPDGAAEPIAVSGLGGSRSAIALNPTAGKDAAPDTNVGTVLAFAAEPGKVALDGAPGQNSPYAAALIKHLSAMAGDEFGLVMRMVAEEVYLKTGGQQRPWVNESMRRLLYLGQTPDQPTGAEGDILSERRGLLVKIATLPDPERRAVEAVATETGVPMDALYGMLSALGSEVPSDPARLGALLRGQTDKVKAMIAERDTLKSTDPEIVRLSSLADEALAEGALNTAIALRQQAKERAKEVEATVEDAEEQLKQRRIELAQVYAKSAEAYALAFKHREAALDYEEAARQVEKWDDQQTFWYIRSAATAWLESGKLRGGASDLEKSVEAGRSAAAMVARLLADNPDDADYWKDIAAQTNNNFANATNALSSATKKREDLLASITTYQDALKILSRDRVPLDWAVVQQNLAGSYMMLGETDDDNAMLQRAIDAFDEALTVWTRESDAGKWALVTANKAGAIALLGQNKNDRKALDEAIAMLKSALEVQTQDTMPLDWAWTQRRLGYAYSELARVTLDRELLKKSFEATQEALRVYTLGNTPRIWAQTMHDMAVAETKVTSSKTSSAARESAIAIYDQVIAAISLDQLPTEYALSAGNRAMIDIDIGRDNRDAARVEKGIVKLREILAVYEGLQRPRDILRTMLDLGPALVSLGNIRSSAVEPQQAIELYAKADALARQDGKASDIDDLRAKLAFAQVELGYQRSMAKDYPGAAEAYQASLDLRDRDKDLKNWLFSANQTAIALQTLGRTQNNVDTMRKAVATYRMALEATPDSDQKGWIETQNNLISVLNLITEQTNAAADYLPLSDAYAALTTAKDKARERDGRDIAAANSLWALSVAGELGNDESTLEKAAAGYRALLKTNDLNDQDRVFHTLQMVRTLFFVASASQSADPQREAIALIDANWPLLEKAATPEARLNTLLDRANLIYSVSSKTPGSYTPQQIEEAYQRAVGSADATANPAGWRNAQYALLGYQLADVENPAFPAERMQSALGSLKVLYDATPKQSDPAAWAQVANWYGYTLSLRGKRESTPASFQEALPILHDALSTFESVADHNSAAHTRDSLCTALVGLGKLQKQRDLIAQGVDQCGKAVAYMRDKQMAEVLPIAEANLAEANKALAEIGAQ